MALAKALLHRIGYTAEKVILEKAGIALKKTPKGWVATGVPQEYGDELKQVLGGRRYKDGRQSFQKDPAERLAQVARDITEESRRVAERDADAKARGLVVVGNLTLTPKEAEWYEQEREARLAAQGSRAKP